MRTRTSSIDTDRTLVVIAYVLHLIGAIAGITSLIGLLINYFHDSRSYYGGYHEALAENHHRWMIRSFWWALLWIIIGWLTTVLLFGWVILGITWLWYLYRHLRGLLALLADRPLPR